MSPMHPRCAQARRSLDMLRDLQERRSQELNGDDSSSDDAEMAESAQ